MSEPDRGYPPGRLSLVTVGIGGNDADLIGVAEECAELDAPF
jgi:hypothetical protein